MTPALAGAATAPSAAAAPLAPSVPRHRLASRSLAPWLFLAPTLAAGLLFYAMPAVFLV